MSYLIDKYRPTCVKHFFGYNDIIKKLDKWLNNYKNDYTLKGGVLLSGKPGIGKSLFIKLFLKERGFHVHNFNSNRNPKFMVNDLKKIKNSSDIKIMFTKLKPFSIVVDDIDSISTVGSKVYISEIIHMINPFKGKKKLSTNDKSVILKKRKVPIICICSNKFDKKISEIKKNCLNIDITIEDKYIIKLINFISSRENITFENNTIKKNIIKYAKRNIRQIINFLEELKLTYKDDIIKQEHIEKYNIKIHKKDNSLFLSTHKILFKKLSIIENENIFNIDTFFIPLMIFQNYLLKSEKDITELQCISNLLSISDNFDKQIFKNQYWSLKNYQPFLTCFYINSCNKKEISSDKISSDKISSDKMLSEIDNIEYTIYPSKISNRLLISKYMKYFVNKYNLENNFDSYEILYYYKKILIENIIHNEHKGLEFMLKLDLNAHELEQFNKILRFKPKEKIFTYKFKSHINKVLAQMKESHDTI